MTQTHTQTMTQTQTQTQTQTHTRTRTHANTHTLSQTHDYNAPQHFLHRRQGRKGAAQERSNFIGAGAEVDDGVER